MGRSNPGDPTFEQLMTIGEQLIAKHPRTIFIGAHIGSNEDDLAYASHLLDKYPNYYVDMAARVAALGREPYTARRFLIRYQDRVYSRRMAASDGGHRTRLDRRALFPQPFRVPRDCQRIHRVSPMAFESGALARVRGRLATRGTRRRSTRETSNGCFRRMRRSWRALRAITPRPRHRRRRPGRIVLDGLGCGSARSRLEPYDGPAAAVRGVVLDAIACVASM